jgi:hypothetical protein
MTSREILTAGGVCEVADQLTQPETQFPADFVSTLL